MNNRDCKIALSTIGLTFVMVAGTVVRASLPPVPEKVTVETAERAPIKQSLASKSSDDIPEPTTTLAPTTTTKKPKPVATTTIFEIKAEDWIDILIEWQLHLENLTTQFELAQFHAEINDVRGMQRACRAGLQVVKDQPTSKIPDYDTNNYLRQANEAARVMFEGCLTINVPLVQTAGLAFTEATDNAIARMEALLIKAGK